MSAEPPIASTARYLAEWAGCLSARRARAFRTYGRTARTSGQSVAAFEEHVSAHASRVASGCRTPESIVCPQCQRIAIWSAREGWADADRDLGATT